MTEKLHVKIVVSHFFPEVNALTNRLDSLLPLLAREQKVTVIYLLQPGESFDEERTRAAYPGLDLELLPVEAARYDKGGFIRRSLGESRNARRLWRRARQVKADVLFQSVPQLMLLYVSLLFVPSDTSARKILEIRDLTWEYVNFGSGLVGRMLRRLTEKLAIAAISKFDEVAACTSGQADFVNKHTDCEVTVVRNGIAEDKFDELSAIAEAGDKGPKVISYFGTLGHAQNMMTFARAAARLADRDDIEFRLVGDGPDKDKIREFRNEHGLEHLKLVDKVPWSRLLELYAESTILYAQLKKGDEFKTAEPSKLFEYFSTGKPVIYGGEGLSVILASEFENAWVIDPDDVDQLARAVTDAVAKCPPKSEQNIEHVRRSFVREAIFETYLKDAGLI